MFFSPCKSLLIIISVCMYSLSPAGNTLLTNAKLVFFLFFYLINAGIEQELASVFVGIPFAQNRIGFSHYIHFYK